MALFDTGKSTLKPGLDKLLVNSLLGIKRQTRLADRGGRPHTDSIGNDKSNQQLPLNQCRGGPRLDALIPAMCRRAVLRCRATAQVVLSPDNETPEGAGAKSPGGDQSGPAEGRLSDAGHG